MAHRKDVVHWENAPYALDYIRRLLNDRPRFLVNLKQLDYEFRGDAECDYIEAKERFVKTEGVGLINDWARKYLNEKGRRRFVLSLNQYHHSQRKAAKNIRIKAVIHERLAAFAKQEKITLEAAINRLLDHVVIMPEPGETLNQAPQKPVQKTIKLNLWLRVERNSKFVRGKKKAREEIEHYVLAPLNAKKTEKDRWDYEITLSYDDDEDLERQIYALYGEMESTADLRNCFIEADIWDPETERSW